jgi:hypothetical protein
MSCGFIVDEVEFNKKKKAFKAIPGNENSTLQDFYLHLFELAPATTKIMTESRTFVEVGKDGGPGVRQASDYSYSASHYAGPGYRLVGDAACEFDRTNSEKQLDSHFEGFIDPYFSSGVHLAFTAALSAAATIASTIRGVPEEAAIKWHNTKVGVAYNRYVALDCLPLNTGLTLTQFEN